MGAPNPDDPLANDVATHWKSDEKGAIEKGIAKMSEILQLIGLLAREWTRAYAQANTGDKNHGVTV